MAKGLSAINVGDILNKNKEMELDYPISTKKSKYEEELSLVFSETIDEETMKNIKHGVILINKATNESATKIGEVLSGINEEISKKGYGIWREFLSKINVDRNKATRLISRYKFIYKHIDKQELIESLPVSLTYEISSPSANQDLVNKVLAGEIKTRKAYIEEIKALETNFGESKVIEPALEFDGEIISKEITAVYESIRKFDIDKFKSKDKKKLINYIEKIERVLKAYEKNS